MERSSDFPHGAYVPTGWRIVGPGADRIAERLVAAAEARLDPGDPSATLYAVQCTADPVVSGRPVVERILDAVTDEVRRTWPECPRLQRDTPADRPPSRLGGLRYEVLATPGREWVGEVVWRSVHPVVAGAAITTQLLIEERSSYTRFTVRVTADAGLTSVRGYVGAGHAQPSFIAALARDIPLTWLGGPLRAHALRRGEIADFVRSVLESPTRGHPVAVLAPEEGGTFVVPPDALMLELFGRAQLYVIHDHRDTFELSDTVGDRRMSCYWGAVRCYMPEWTRYDDPRDHPLLIADRLADPVMRAAWLGEIGTWIGPHVAMPPDVQERRERARAKEKPAAPRTSPPIAIESTTTTTTQPSPTPAPAEAAQAFADPGPLLRTVLDELRTLVTSVTALRDEVEQLKTISAVRSSSTAAMERRLGRLENLLETVFPTPSEARAARPALTLDDDADEGSTTLSDVVQAAAEAHGDALLFLDNAHGSAKDSPYEDPERVRAILDAMAHVARRRRDGNLGTSLREAFSELGIDYRPAISRNTSARMREQYRFRLPSGDVIEAEEHIAVGNTYDPRRCLRVYFSSRMPNEPRFVIGHVGRHFTVATTT